MEFTPAARLLVALDTPDRVVAERLISQLAPYVGGFKIGPALFTVAGPSVVTKALATGARVFLDLKLHDIPHTVAGAVAAAVRLGVHLLTVHTLGGRTMLQAALAPLATLEQGTVRPTILGVTLLTSADQSTLEEVGLAGTPEQVVLRLARLAVDCGLGGVVCSPHEVAAIRRLVPEEFVIVTPGVRPAGSALEDQQRVATPQAALAAGATYLVVGRPITAAADPVAAARHLVEEMAAF